ncbi:hypothetical protein NDS46_17675 [Paenibacillus thiaminolyticus]|uniref:hypothetical protein n=1 Tax=Paenibacillus thiaminolyticus TaxID=49283 RepID=UPI00232BA3F5|nr:hypothetical protein [Paenibacillus thiaminolyticus]WCF06188.1 hypothetical protein NDS46_17675 [Paenibacillus thiaminolyticus]
MRFESHSLRITCHITEEHFRYRGNTLVGTGIPDKAIVMHNKEITKLATAKIDAAVVRSHGARPFIQSRTMLGTNQTVNTSPKMGSVKTALSKSGTGGFGKNQITGSVCFRQFP